MSDAAQRERILLVEDEALIALYEQRLLAKAGYGVEIVHRGEEAVDKALSAAPDLVLMDVDLGKGIDGGEAAKRIREAGGPPVVFLSSHSESAVIEKTRHAGGYGYIVKGSGDTVLLTSVRMALDLAAAHEHLAASEERWSSLARTAPDAIFSINRDRRIVSINRGIGELSADELIGVEFVGIIEEEDRASFEKALERVFTEGITLRQPCRIRARNETQRRYELFIGPALDPSGAVASATVVARDVTAQFSFASGAELSPEEREREVLAAMAAFDFSPIRELCAAFAELTGVGLNIVSRDGRVYVALSATAVCRDFHRAGAESFALCRQSDKQAEVLLPNHGEKAYLEYTCPFGLKEIALPLSIEGVHWGTLFTVQFLYDEDEIDENLLERNARLFGWDRAAYSESYRKTPRFSRTKIIEAMRFFTSLGKTVSKLAYEAYRTRILSRYSVSASIDAAISAALESKDRLYSQLQHRIKNSLALITSLLSLQAEEDPDSRTAHAMEAASSRVRAVGLLYEQLHRTRSVESVDLAAYLEHIVEAAASSRRKEPHIALEADCEHITIGTDRAVTIGLIVNELAMNAVQHAFTEGTEGLIRLSLKLDGTNVVLEFQDNGRGLPPNFILHKAKTLGALLLTSLSGQLGGQIETGTGLGGAGTGFRLSFPVAAGLNRR
jgi:PAS domain S-box-containing protein